MTAGHDDRDGLDGQDGLDPLLAVLMDEPAPPGADAAYLAGRRAAEADVALLRRELTALGDALAGPPAAQDTPEQQPAPVRAVRPVRRRRLLPAALGLAAAGAVVTLLGWLVVQTGNGTGGGDDSATGATASDAKPAFGGRFDNPEYFACAALIAEGDVTDVRRVPGAAGHRVTLRVTRAYKPERTAPTVTVTVEDETAPAPRAGDHVLVGLQREALIADLWISGETAIAPERQTLTDQLTAAQGLPCP
ncbi:hypothetical protein [Streptomyces griseosporeus]|uniref:hypothetical protein n=1 Tax=Streptomyces griseosporeus TaxID=1910 RepID=UPI00167E2203|nr:hypothetical protein [Streptomyces griseosporeus]GHF68965.1 hypothetical protein GCM10018783_42960 [Streptomyces griseosporeus]